MIVTRLQLLMLLFISSTITINGKTIQIACNDSLIERSMQATHRVIPTIKLQRVARGMIPYITAAVYLVYVKTEEEINQMTSVIGDLARALKPIIGGNKLKEEYERRKFPQEKFKKCSYGLSSYLKPFNNLVKIDTDGCLIKLTLLDYFKDSLLQDLKDLKDWSTTTIRSVHEELTHSYCIPDNVPLSERERALYIYYLRDSHNCRCMHYLNEAILCELTEGCTATDLEKIVRDCSSIENQVFEQIATYYAGKALIQKLLNPEANVRTIICPVNGVPNKNLFGKIEVRTEQQHELTVTTPEAYREACMVACAGDMAAQIRDVHLSTVFTQHSKKNFQNLMFNCTTKNEQEFCEDIQCKVREMLLTHSRELDTMVAILKQQWEIANDLLEEILATINS